MNLKKSNVVAIAIVPVALLALAVGCAKKNGIPKNESVTDVSVAPVPPREPEAAYAGPLLAAPVQQAPMAYPAEPVVVTQTPAIAAPATAGAGGSYTVKKGDTLFSIAKQAYGSGNQWQRIASANPGLSPSTLKAGQTIVLP